MNEYGKRCQLCWKYRQSRIYYRKIKGKFIKICMECWDSLEDKKKQGVK